MPNNKVLTNKPQVKKKPRRISDVEKREILQLKREDITFTKIKELFANSIDDNNVLVDAKFLPNDTFILNKGYLYNESQLETTVGRYIFNLFIFSPNILKQIGYQNEPVNKKNYGKIQGKLSTLFKEDKITSEELMDYINRCQWLGFRISRVLLPSLTQQLIIPDEAIVDKKNELANGKYKKALETADKAGVNKMEKELIEYSNAINADNPDMELYDSGVFSYGNAYKNSTLMRGIIKNSGTGETIASTASLEEGIPPEEMYMYSDLMVQATSSRALGTAEGGYEGKKLVTAFQDLHLAPKDSDCGTTLTLKVNITSENKNSYKYRYMVDKNGKLVLLTDEVLNSLVGKSINLRSPMFCKDDVVCNKCLGEQFYMEGREYYGILLKRIATRVLNIALKAFHDMTIHMATFNPDDYID